MLGNVLAICLEKSSNHHDEQYFEIEVKNTEITFEFNHLQSVIWLG